MKFTAKLLFVFVFFCGCSFLDHVNVHSAKANNGSEYESQKIKIPEIPLTIEVILKRSFLDGEVSEEVVNETIWRLEDFWAKYDSWQLKEMDEDRIVFEKTIDDISPLLKINGFFGVSEDGMLSIFNGSPEQADIIQSFFQIDMKKLEGKQRQQLEKGIPVKSKEVFNEILETMKHYSKEEQIQ